MPSFDAGSISSRLELDRAPFTASLSIARSMAAQFEANDVTATLKGNINPLLAAVRSARASLQNFSRESYEATITAQTRRAKERVWDLQNDLREVGRARPTATVNANTLPGRRALDGFEETMRRYSRSWGGRGIRAKVAADTQQAQRSLRMLERQLESVTDERHRIQINADTLRTRQRLEALGRIATALGMKRPTISVGMRGRAATFASMLGLQRMADRLDGANIRFRASVDQSLSRALPNLLGALEIQVTRWRTIMTAVAAVTMPVFYSSLAAIPALASAAAGAVGSLAIAVGQGLAGGAGIAATALTQGLAGGIGAVGVAVGLGGAALLGYGAALRGTINYTRNLTDTIEGQIKTVGDAGKVLKEAKRRLDEAAKGTLEYERAQRAVALAQENSRYEQERLNILYDIATPRVRDLIRATNNSRLRMLAFGGAIMHTVAPAIIYAQKEFGRFSASVGIGTLKMLRQMDATARGFVYAASRGQTLKSITTILKGIQAAGQPALRTVGNAAITLVNILARIVPTALGVLSAMDRGAAAARRFSESAAGQRRIADVWALLARQGQRLGQIAWNTGRILLRVFAPATPYAEAFLGYLVRITNQAARWAESARGQEAIAGTWAKLARRGQWLWRVATDLGAALWGVMVALEDSGTVDFMATSVERLTKRFRNFMSATGEGRRKIIEFMQDARPILVAAASLAKEAADQFFRIAGEVISFRKEGSKLTVLEEIFKSIEKSLKPLADFLLYEFKKIGPLIGPLIEELSTWFATMARSQPEMKFFIQFLTDMLGLFNSLPYETQRNIARIIAYTAAIKALGGFAVIGAIGSFVSVIGGIFRAKQLWANTVAVRGLAQAYKDLAASQAASAAAPAPVAPVAGPRRGGAAGRFRRIPPPVVPAPTPAKGFWQTFRRRIGRTPPVVAPTVPAPAPARGFWRRMPRTAPPIVAPVIPAPVPAGGFAPTATRRVAGTGIAAAIGGFFARMWGRIPFSAQIGRAFSRIRIGAALRTVGAWGGRIGGALLGGISRVLFGPIGLAALVADLVTGGAISKGAGELATDFISGFKRQWGQSGNWLSGLFRGLLGGIWEALNFGDMVEGFKRRYRESMRQGNVGALGSETISAIAQGLLGALGRIPLVGPFIGWLDRNIAKPIKNFFEIGSPSRKAARWGRWIVEGLLQGIRSVPVIGGMIAKAQALYRGASRAFRRGGWRGLGAWAVNQIGAGLRQTPLGGLAAKAQRVFNGARQAFRQGGWRGLGAWAVNQIAAGLRGTPLGGIAAKAQRLFTGARQAFRRGGWRGLGVYVVNAISGGLRGTRLAGLAAKAQSLFVGARRAFRRGGWRGLGAFVVNSISGGLRGTRFYNFGVKVQNFFRGARLAFRRGGWRGLGVYVVNRISAGLRGTRFYNFAVKVANFFRGARAAYRRQGWRGLGRYVVQQVSAGLRGTRFYNFAAKVANFFRGARAAFRRGGWRGLGTYVVNSISSGLRGTRLASLGRRLGNLYNNAASYVRGSRWYNLGRNIVIGIINGLNSADFGNRLMRMAVNAWNRVVRFFRTRSPSLRMAWLGNMLARGMAGGITKNAHRAVNAALDMARRVAAAAQVRANVAIGAKPGTVARPPARPAPRPVLRPAPPRPVPRPVPRPTPTIPKPPATPAGPPLIQPILNLTVPVQQDMDAAEEKAIEAAVATVKEAFAEVRKQAASNTGYLANEIG